MRTTRKSDIPLDEVEDVVTSVKQEKNLARQVLAVFSEKAGFGIAWSYYRIS